MRETFADSESDLAPTLVLVILSELVEVCIFLTTGATLVAVAVREGQP